MAEQEAPNKTESRPVTGFYVFMGLVVVTLLVIIGYVVHSYLIG